MKNSSVEIRDRLLGSQVLKRGLASHHHTTDQSPLLQCQKATSAIFEFANCAGPPSNSYPASTNYSYQRRKNQFQIQFKSPQVFHKVQRQLLQKSQEPPKKLEYLLKLQKQSLQQKIVPLIMQQNFTRSEQDLQAKTQSTKSSNLLRKSSLQVLKSDKIVIENDQYNSVFGEKIEPILRTVEKQGRNKLSVISSSTQSLKQKRKNEKILDKVQSINQVDIQIPSPRRLQESNQRITKFDSSDLEFHLNMQIFQQGDKINNTEFQMQEKQFFKSSLGSLTPELVHSTPQTLLQEGVKNRDSSIQNDEKLQTDQNYLSNDLETKKQAILPIVLGQNQILDCSFQPLHVITTENNSVQTTEQSKEMERKYNDSRLSNQNLPQNLNEKLKVQTSNQQKDLQLKEAIINVLERKNQEKSAQNQVNVTNQKRNARQFKININSQKLQKAKKSALQEPIHVQKQQSSRKENINELESEDRKQIQNEQKGKTISKSQKQSVRNSGNFKAEKSHISTKSTIQFDQKEQKDNHVFNPNSPKSILSKIKPSLQKINFSKFKQKFRNLQQERSLQNLNLKQFGSSEIPHNLPPSRNRIYNVSQQIQQEKQNHFKTEASVLLQQSNKFDPILNRTQSSDFKLSKLISRKSSKHRIIDQKTEALQVDSEFKPTALIYDKEIQDSDPNFGMYKISDHSYDKKRFAPSKPIFRGKQKTRFSKKLTISAQRRDMKRNGTLFTSNQANSQIGLKEAIKRVGDQFKIYETNPNLTLKKNEAKSSIKMLKDFNTQSGHDPILIENSSGQQAKFYSQTSQNNSQSNFSESKSVLQNLKIDSATDLQDYHLENVEFIHDKRNFNSFKSPMIQSAPQLISPRQIQEYPLQSQSQINRFNLKNGLKLLKMQQILSDQSITSSQNVFTPKAHNRQNSGGGPSGSYSGNDFSRQKQQIFDRGSTISSRKLAKYDRQSPKRKNQVAKRQQKSVGLNEEEEETLPQIISISTSKQLSRQISPVPEELNQYLSQEQKEVQTRNSTSGIFSQKFSLDEKDRSEELDLQVQGKNLGQPKISSKMQLQLKKEEYKLLSKKLAKLNRMGGLAVVREHEDSLQNVHLSIGSARQPSHQQTHQQAKSSSFYSNSPTKMKISRGSFEHQNRVVNEKSDSQSLLLEKPPTIDYIRINAQRMSLNRPQIKRVIKQSSLLRESLNRSQQNETLNIMSTFQRTLSGESLKSRGVGCDLGITFACQTQNVTKRGEEPFLITNQDNGEIIAIVDSESFSQLEKQSNPKRLNYSKSQPPQGQNLKSHTQMPSYDVSPKRKRKDLFEVLEDQLSKAKVANFIAAEQAKEQKQVIQVGSHSRQRSANSDLKRNQHLDMNIKIPKKRELLWDEVNLVFQKDIKLQQAVQIMQNSNKKTEFLPSVHDKCHGQTQRIHFHRRQAFEDAPLLIVMASDLLILHQRQILEQGFIQRETASLDPNFVLFLAFMTQTHQIALIIDFGDVRFNQWAGLALLKDFWLQFDGVYIFHKMQSPSFSALNLDQILDDFRIYSQFGQKVRKDKYIVDNFLFLEANREQRYRVWYNKNPVDKYLHILLGKSLASYQPLLLAEIVYDAQNSKEMKEIQIFHKILKPKLSKSLSNYSFAKSESLNNSSQAMVLLRERIEKQFQELVMRNQQTSKRVKEYACNWTSRNNKLKTAQGTNDKVSPLMAYESLPMFSPSKDTIEHKNNQLEVFSNSLTNNGNNLAINNQSEDSILVYRQQQRQRAPSFADKDILSPSSDDFYEHLSANVSENYKNLAQTSQKIQNSVKLIDKRMKHIKDQESSSYRLIEIGNKLSLESHYARFTWFVKREHFQANPGNTIDFLSQPAKNNNDTLAVELFPNLPNVGGGSSSEIQSKLSKIQYESRKSSIGKSKASTSKQR